MELFLHIWTNLEYFDLLNKGKLLSQGKKDRELASFFMQNFPWELAESISPQYEVNFMAIREIKKKFWNNFFDKISWIYYWSDNCEYLVPTKNEIEKAIEDFKEFNKNFPPHKVRTFVLVTPYLWDKMLERLEKGLEYLNNLKIKNPIEVVVNDFWTLNLLNKKFKNLNICFGRLLHKQLKTPLIDTYWYEVHPAWELIKNKTKTEKEQLKKDIIKWQMKFYNSSEVWLDLYRNFLNRFWVKNIAIDYMQNRKWLYKNYDWIWTDLYYPWALVFTWRLCDTSAIENEYRWYYATDDICPRTCNRYDISYKIKTVWYKMIQRWNSWYRSELDLSDLNSDFIWNNDNRLIFSPFVPI